MKKAVETVEKLKRLPFKKAEKLIEQMLDDFDVWCLDEGRKQITATMLSYLESTPAEDYSVPDLFESTFHRLRLARRKLRSEQWGG